MEMRMFSGDASALEMEIKQEENDDSSEVGDFLACKPLLLSIKNIIKKEENDDSNEVETFLASSKANRELCIYRTYDAALEELRAMRNAEDLRMLVKHSQSFLSLVKDVLKNQKDYENHFSIERDSSESNLMKISSKGWNTSLLNRMEEHIQLISNARKTATGRVLASLGIEFSKNNKINLNLCVDRRNFN